MTEPNWVKAGSMFVNLDNSTTVCPDNAGGVQVYFVGDADDNVRLTEEEAASLLVRLEFEVAKSRALNRSVNDDTLIQTL